MAAKFKLYRKRLVDFLKDFPVDDDAKDVRLFIAEGKTHFVTLTTEINGDIYNSNLMAIEPKRLRHFFEHSKNAIVREANKHSKNKT